MATKGMIRTLLAVVLVVCGLAVAAWCRNSFVEYATCRDTILAEVDRAFSLGLGDLKRLDAIVGRYAEKRELGNYLAVLMRNECNLAPTQHRDSAEHRLLWVAFLKMEDSDIIARLVLSAARGRSPQRRFGPESFDDEQLECLVQHALRLPSRERCGRYGDRNGARQSSNTYENSGDM